MRGGIGDEISPLHAAIWARQLAQELQARGIAPGPLLARAGLGRGALAEDTPQAPFDRIARFFELAAEAAGDPVLGLRFGLTRDARDAGLIGYVGLSSPDLGTALTGLARLHRVFSDALDVDISGLGADEVAWSFRGDPAAPRGQAEAFSLGNILGFLRRASGRRLVPVQVGLPGPGGEAEAAARLLGCPVRREGAWVRMALPEGTLRLAVQTADQRLLAILQGHCRDVLERMAPRQSSLSERVTRALADGLSRGAARQEAVAAGLGMSPRSLTRRLAEEGTSFARLLDELRRDLALAHLAEDGLDVTQVAFVLGYAEPSSFAHAFRRWTGQSPSDWRRGRPGGRARADPSTGRGATAMRRPAPRSTV